MDELRAYQILGIEPGCNMEELRAAYANLSKKYHPEESPEEFQQIHEAYALLKGRVRRGSRKNTCRQEPERKIAGEREASAYHFDEIIQNPQGQPEETTEEKKKTAIRFEEYQGSYHEAEAKDEAEKRYDFEDALRQGEQKENQRIHESVLKALAEAEILFSPQYCNKMKLWKAFFAKPEYQEAIHTAEFVSGFADLLANKKLKKSLYFYFVNVYRLRGANPSELMPEMRKLYVILDQKAGGIKNGTNQKFLYGGIPAAVVIGLRAARIHIENMQAVIALIYIAVAIFLCYLIFKKIYENHSAIFAQAIVALLVFVVQIVGILTPLYGKIFGSVETGDVFGVMIMMLALFWFGVLGVAAIIQAVRRRSGRK